MRVQRIDLFSNNRQVASFETAGPDRRNPYVLKAIDGLDAEQITPKFYGQGEVDGVNFTELSLEPREIVINLALQPKWAAGETPATLRSNLLKAIASNRSGVVQLRFYDDEVAVGVIEGFITKFNTPASRATSEVTITVKCENPLFRSLDVTSQIVESLSTTAPLVIDPVSTAPHGFKFKATATGSMNPFTIQDDPTTPNWVFQIDYPFITGDEIYFSSEENDKYIYRVRSAVTLRLMDVLALGSVWPVIFPGENQLYVVGTNFGWDEFYWYETHWGI